MEYDIWYHWLLNNRCNLNCEYCFENPYRETAKIPTIDIPKLIKIIDKTGKTFRISFTGGGEPFLVTNLIEACVELTKKHYISFNTNLTPKKIKTFAKEIDPERVIFIIGSLHIKELERLNLVETYIEHFHLLKEMGFNIVAIVVAHPSLVAEADKYRNYFKNQGISIIFENFIGEYNGRRYPEAYTNEEKNILDLKPWKDIHNQQGKLCNAGYNVGIITAEGHISPCFSLQKSIGNIYEKINMDNKMIRCPFEFCGCPLNVFDPYLFNKACKETKETLEKTHIMEFVKSHSYKTNLKNIISAGLPDSIYNPLINFYRNKIKRKYRVNIDN